MSNALIVLAEFDEEVIPFESWAGRHRIIAWRDSNGAERLSVQLWREETGEWRIEGLGSSSAQAVLYAFGRVLGYRFGKGEPEGALPRITARPLAEWHEDDGPVLWWKLPVDEPPWVGTPLDDDWPMPGGPYYTHWTPLPMLPVARGDSPGA